MFINLMVPFKSDGSASEGRVFGSAVEDGVLGSAVEGGVVGGVVRPPQ